LLRRAMERIGIAIVGVGSGANSFLMHREIGG
jgi:hypothetical protein